MEEKNKTIKDVEEKAKKRLDEDQLQEVSGGVLTDEPLTDDEINETEGGFKPMIFIKS